jgi:peptide/nickel transport system permease protein
MSIGADLVDLTGLRGPTGSDARLRGGDRPVSAWRRMVVTFAQNKLALVGVALLLAIVFFSFLGPLLYHTNQVRTNFAQADLAPGAGGHPLGTDNSGYDVLGRLMAGGQTSLIVGFAAAGLAAIGGSVFGAIAGFAGKAADMVLMRFVDGCMSIPQLLVVIILATIFIPSRLSLTIVIASISWFPTARLVRGEALRIVRLEYVEASKAAGSRGRWILFRHILPNSIGVIVVSATFQVATAILLVASLSFLGLGIPPPAASWGGMLATGLQYIYDGYWWMIYPAGLLIVLTIMACNFVGDGLRDAFEARLQRN